MLGVAAGDASAAPLVSIVITNFNGEAFVHEAVESALRQAYPRVEVVVVDDGSTDGSLRRLEAYDSRIALVAKANGGQASAFNAGFAACHGGIVIFLDADDTLQPGAAARAVMTLADAHTSVVQWPLTMTGDPRWEGIHVPRLALSHGALLPHVATYGPASHVAAPTSGNAWARWYLAKVLPMPEEPFRLSADDYLHTLAPVYGDVRALTRALGRYRIHAANRYFHLTALEKAADFLAGYAPRRDILAHHLALNGIAAEPGEWPARNPHYGWRVSVRRMLSTLADVVPENHRFVLVDGGKFGCGRSIVPGRVGMAFSERNGRFSGLPWTDADIERELAAARAAGATYLVVLSTMNRWLERHRAVTDLWPSRFRRVHADDDVTIYALTTRADAA
jgi:glycosyltransferase involved in cell wall biosynthesis